MDQTQTTVDSEITDFDNKSWLDIENMVFEWTTNTFFAREKPSEHECRAYYKAMFKNAGMNQCGKWIAEGKTPLQIQGLIDAQKKIQWATKILTQDHDNFVDGLEFLLSCYQRDLEQACFAEAS
jgi:hypothetical protein